MLIWVQTIILWCTNIASIHMYAYNFLQRLKQKYLRYFSKHWLSGITLWHSLSIPSQIHNLQQYHSIFQNALHNYHCHLSCHHNHHPHYRSHNNSSLLSSSHHIMHNLYISPYQYIGLFLFCLYKCIRFLILKKHSL